MKHALKIPLLFVSVFTLVVLFGFTARIHSNSFGKQKIASHLVDLGAMHEMRASHTATRLLDGKVLLAGGFKKGADGYSQIYFNSAELFDPTTNSFTETGSMYQSRCGFTATLLPNGKVLVAGGYGDDGLLSSAELYDPSTEKFSRIGNMSVNREGHTATLLSN